MKRKLAIVAVGALVVTGSVCVVVYKKLNMPLQDGLFVSTYVPKGWTVVNPEDTTGAFTGYNSPDYLFEESTAIRDCRGSGPDGYASGGCAMGDNQVLGKGAYFQLAYNPCVYNQTEAEFRKGEQENSAGMLGLVDQKTIIIQGHKAVLFHLRNITNTTHPAIENDYRFTVVSIPEKGICQDVNFGYIDATSTNYYGEYQKIINGLQFVPGKKLPNI